MSLEDRLYPLLGLYERLPHPVRVSIGSLYRTLPESFRIGKSYAKFSHLASAETEFKNEVLAQYQTAEIREQLTQAYEGCEYYRREFKKHDLTPADFRSLADLKRFPCLTKENLQHEHRALLNEKYSPSARLHITTGGSTGVPVGFELHKGISRPKEQAFLEAMWTRAGYRKGMRLALIRGHVTTDRIDGPIARYDATRDWLILSSYHLNRARLAEYLDDIARFRPDLLHAYPSSALMLAELSMENGFVWKTPLKALLCGSEQLTDPQKALLEGFFGCRVYRWYGHSERVVLAGEGRRTSWFYFFPQYGYTEFGPPDEDGLQEVIGTSFHNRVMPLIRYRTGDLVKLVPDDHPDKEFPWPAAEYIAGRKHEFLVSKSGRKISLTAFNMHTDVFQGLVAIQFFQEVPGEAEFRYVADASFDPNRLPSIKREILVKLGQDFLVTLRPVQETEKTARGKHKWLVSTLPQQGQASAS